MTGPEALRGLLTYAQDEAEALKQERVAQLIALAIAELSNGTAPKPKPFARREGDAFSGSGPGYLQ